VHYRTQSDLLRRIKQLEDQLRLASDDTTCRIHSDKNDGHLTPQTSPGVCQVDGHSVQPSESEEIGQAVDDDEATVDLIATDAFNEKHQSHVGYFGSIFRLREVLLG
jgi:hypothetical protein